MRIIAGLRRGHKFDGPEDRHTRPTSDMVRESIFNILGDEIEGREAVDLFAGTGALGLEALSRGARRAVFVEKNRDNVGLIRRNVATLRFEDRAAVVPIDAYRYMKGYEVEPGVPVLLFVDPPYAEYTNHTERFRGALESLIGRLPAGSIVVVEAPERRPESVLPDPDSWDVRRYGSTVVAFRNVGARAGVEPGPGAGPGPESEGGREP